MQKEQFYIMHLTFSHLPTSHFLSMLRKSGAGPSGLQGWEKSERPSCMGLRSKHPKSSSFLSSKGPLPRSSWSLFFGLFLEFHWRALVYSASSPLTFPKTRLGSCTLKELHALREQRCLPLPIVAIVSASSCLWLKSTLFIRKARTPHPATHFLACTAEVPPNFSNLKVAWNRLTPFAL